jgi:hypothetical protein
LSVYQKMPPLTEFYFIVPGQMKKLLNGIDESILQRMPHKVIISRFHLMDANRITFYV